MALKTEYKSSYKELDVPYISQFTDIKDNVYFALTGCGLVSVFMVIYYRNQKTINEGCLQDLSRTLVQARENPEAYCEAGWRHDFFVSFAIERGFPSSRRKEKMKEEDLLEIIDFLHNGKPVVVSVKRECLSMTIFHMVVLTGYRTDEEGNLLEFIYNDPAALYSKIGAQRSVNIQTFLSFWRGMAIFID